MHSGTRREPTRDELADSRTLLRANAVVAVRTLGETSLTPNEQRVASYIDGLRPIARVRLKCGLTAEEFRHALRALARKDLLILVGVIDESQSELRGLKEEVRGDSQEGEPAAGATMPKALDDAIPPHVMREIEAMIEEESRLAKLAKVQESEPTDVGLVRPRRGPHE